jgi:integrase/recombinase XerC
MAVFFMPGTIRDILSPFLDYLKFEKRYSAHTIRSYQSDLLQLDDYLQLQLGGMEAGALSPVILRSWLAGMKESGLESRSINRKISSAKSFFRFHQRKGTLAVNPAITLKVMKTGKRLPSFLKEEQTKELMDVEEANSWKGRTEKLLLEILYNSGIRVSELVNLKEKHIDIHQSALKVLGKGNKERIVPLKQELLKIIIDYRDSKKKVFKDFDDEYLLVNSHGKKLNTQYAYRAVKHLLGELSTTSKRHPHLMRHTFATQLANNGADLNAIKELLGHSSLAATQVYTHNTIEKLKDIHQKAHPRG